jgi:NAD+ kinase
MSRSRRIRRAVVVAKIGPEEGLQIARDLGVFLRREGIHVRFDEETSRALGRKDGVPRSALPRGTDIAIVAGGDGTLLSVARAAVRHGVPILGVNFGGLGFLTELQPDELFDGVRKVLRGEYGIEERHTIRVRFRTGHRHVEYALLNDAVITKGALARMITLEVQIDGTNVSTCTSDGLIISSATGSTAYNLSAGGPILDPRMSAFVLSPICPHTMTYRPLVVPGDVRIDVRLCERSTGVYLTLDGQVGLPMKSGDVLTVDRHPSPVRLVRVTERSFFEVLRRKLHWGNR